MGTLNYAGSSFEFDDRTLAHLKIIIVQKLRRRESFILSWQHHTENGGGRSSIWITDGAPIYFKFHGSKSVSLNREWLDRMMSTTHTVYGLVLDDTPEHVPDVPQRRTDA
ncbi:hypothetical protein ACL9RL_07270 [Plantibacter sp. Mn2098]|uniref:DUF7882 family protein n=1 Tax=Plantibacter sp. Mn2098 TaxID=3395266 RepID=UPI003BC145C5